MGSNPTAAIKFLPNCMGAHENKTKIVRGHTDLNHGPIGLQPIALPLSYIPNCMFHVTQVCPEYCWSIQHMCTQNTLVAVCDISSVIMPSVVEILSSVTCTSVGGIMVSIAAFQAVDPGSIPGRRIFFLFIFTMKISETKCCSTCRDQDSNLGYCGHNAGS